MRGRLYVGLVVATVWVTLVGFFSSVSAERFSGGSYIIDASVAGNSFGGRLSGGSYRLTSSGGESVIGQGSGGSYKLDGGYVAQLPKSVQLTVQPSGLMGYYPLDEPTTNTAFDESANSINGVSVATPTVTSGKIGGAWSFDGATQYAQLGSTSSFSGTEFTLEAWVKTSATSATLTAVSKGSNFWLGIDYNKAAIYDWNTSINCKSTTSVANGAWHHIAATLKSGVTNGSVVYIDGVQSHTCTWTPTAQNGLVGIGASRGASWQNFFNGSIDEVKIYNRAMTAEEVKAEYEAQNAGLPAGTHLNTIIPGASNTASFDAVVQTDTNGYNLAVHQNHDLMKGALPAYIDKQDTYDALSNGTTLSSSNTSAYTVSACCSGTPTATADNTLSPIHSVYGKYSASGGAAYAYSGYEFASFDKRYFRIYTRLRTLPSANQDVLALFDATGGGASNLSEVMVTTTGNLGLRNNFSTVATSTFALAANQWVRLEYLWDKAAGTQTLRIFHSSNLEGNTPDETISGAATGANGIVARSGLVNGPNTDQTVDIDDFASSTTGWIGPSGGVTIPAVAATIASPASWSEGTTKGFGFTLYGANATAIDSKWSSGSAYAALPLVPTSVYVRTGYSSGTKDYLNMRTRLDVAASQEAGTYQNVVTVTVTGNP